VNLLRLLTNGVERPDGSKFDALGETIQAEKLRGVLQDDNATASVVWRRQSDEGVRSWSGSRIFPNLTIIRPHQVSTDDKKTPQLPAPSSLFLGLLQSVKETVTKIARAHRQSFGGFAIAQLEKKLTSSSIAGACSLFTWAVRRCEWKTQDDYKNDKSRGTDALRQLLRYISKRIAEGNPQSKSEHATVSFPSDRYEFPAKDLAQKGSLPGIYDYSNHLRSDDSEAGLWVANEAEICELANLAQRLLGIGAEEEKVEGAQDTKLEWLREMLHRYPDERFILFTESLQTCETLENALGNVCAVLDGSLDKRGRQDAVHKLRDPKGNVRILVATSAADEGIDLQVASKVIHWDLSSSPATLMQRNGRAARLGQLNDVVAYYLILPGTHEERRDSSLQSKFGELGIDDEAMKSRILGSLSEEEEQQLDQAIAENNDKLAGEILRKADGDNKEMDKQLKSISANLQPAQVLSRDNLAKRLKNWKEMGLPSLGTGGITFKFDEIRWDRPVFEATSRREPAVSSTAMIEGNDKDGVIKQLLVFDPEFLVFGPRQTGERARLAGLSPWINQPDRYDKQEILPPPKHRWDLLGRLLRKMARLGDADFLSLPRTSIVEGLLSPSVRWLLFCTHPLREAENVLQPKVRPYLTYYAFNELVDGIVPTPIDVEGADADHVHNFLECAEQHALESKCSDLEDASQLNSAKHAGAILQTWLQSETKFGQATFLEEAKYFAPIPVALVSIREI